MRIITDFAKIVLAGTLIVNVVTLPVYAKGESTPVQEQIPVQPVVLSEEETDIINTVTEDTTTDEEVIVEEQSVTEDVTVSDNPESEEVNETEGVMTFLYEGETRTGAPVAESDGTYKPENLLRTSVVLNPGSVITINSGSDLILLSWVDPKVYQNCVIHVVNNGQGLDTTSSYNYNGTTYTFTGLGNENYPFSGKFKFDELSSATAITLGHSLFNVLSTDTTIVNSNDESISIKLVNGSNTNTALLTDKVVKGTNASGTWNVTVSSSTIEGIVANPPVIGTIDSNCIISLSVADESVLVDEGKTESKLPVSGTGDIGLVCGTLNGQLTLTSLTISAPGVDVDANKLVKVNSSDGNVGGLVGSMGPGASLTTGESIILTFGEISTNKGNAGGLVGKADSGATIKVPSSGLNVTSVTATSGSAGGIAGEATDLKINNIPEIIVPTITGDNAGGLFGSYTYSGTDGELNTVTNNLSDITLKGNNNVGGVFGVLHNNSEKDFNISNVVVNITDMTTGSTGGNAGGLIGQYSSSSLKASLILSSTSVSSKLSASSNTYGGLIGWVSSSSAYIEASGLIVVSGSSSFYGGVIGDMNNDGNVLRVKNITIKKENSIPYGNNAGGLVGRMDGGVLCIDGSVDAVTPNGNADTRGGILGNRGNVLVYTTENGKSNWPYYNSAGCNAIGTWGQVIREDNLQGLLTFDETNHTVTVNGANSSGISSITDFAAVALRFQLNESGSLRFKDGDALPTQLSMTQSLDLSQTGLTGFQRDYNSADKVSVEIMSSEHISITFPDITIYPTGKSHNRQGLFANVNDLDVSNLELKGGTRNNGTNYGITLNGNSNNTYAGAVVAEASGNVKLTNIKSNVNIDASGSLENCRLSGLIAGQTGGTILYRTCEWDSDLKIDSEKAGFMGGFLARAQNTINNIEVSNCIIKGSITKTSGSSYGGGLFGSLYDTNQEKYYKIVINGLTVDGVEIDGSKCTYTGGLLGWEWMNATTTLSDVTINNSSLKAGSQPFGALVYKGSGYWCVQKGSQTGISFENNNIITGKSLNEETSGLLVCRGDKLTNHYNALYLELLDDAYHINSSGMQLEIDTDYFDEIIGVTESELGNGIVSIATNDDKIDTSECNTYKCQLIGQDLNYTNNKTRYYYNLDTFGAAGNQVEGRTLPSGDIDSPEEMVMYSAYTHCYSKLKEYFYSEPGNITGNLDLTGYSYYPSSPEEDISILDARITFDYDGIQDKENQNKQPSNNNCQHANMHTGIFEEVIGINLTVDGLTLSGTVGTYKNNGSGALICGTTHGFTKGSEVTKISLSISNIILSGIKLYQVNDYNPLLINKIDSYSTLIMRNVTTKENCYGDSNNPIIAATSLIGYVGNIDSGRNITLNFGDIGLDARVVSGTSQLYGTYRSIFSKSTLIEAFLCNDAATCSGEYNFKMSEGKYTVGVELSNTSSGRNMAKQYKDLEGKYVYTSVGDSQPNNDNEAATYFTETKYLRYVHKQENQVSKYYELDINQQEANLLEGCGTYSHPYIITDGSQLEALAAAITATTGSYKNGFSVQLKVDSNGNILTDHGHTDISENDHVLYICGEDGTWKDSNNKTLTNDKVINYLRSAYYLIRKDIVVGEKGGWAGLGTPDALFCGVITGGDSYKTINIYSQVSGDQFGGLIKTSGGSVVKNLKIEYKSNVAISGDVSSSRSQAYYAGGVVGWCIDGDTIIENVSLNGFKPELSGKSYLIATGGFVGIVGGYNNANNIQDGGGLVFRGEIVGKLENVIVGGNNVSATDESNGNYFYVNPYVGRVLDGYAVFGPNATVDNKVPEFENTNKNYIIPYLDNSQNLSISNGTVSINSSYDLWLLSAIVNCGAGSKGNTSNKYDGNFAPYREGSKARSSLYDKVGRPSSEDDWQEENQSGTAYPYLIKTFVVEQNREAFAKLTTSGSIELQIKADCDMRKFGNGFRGIGNSYGTNANSDGIFRLPQIKAINSCKDNGSNSVITLNQNRQEYIDEKDSWTSIGSGLFVLLRIPSDGITVSNIIVRGNTSITYFGGTEPSTVEADPTLLGLQGISKDNRLRLVGVGMLVANLARNTAKVSMTLENVQVGDDSLGATVNGTGVGSTSAGGIVGYVWNEKNENNVSVLTFTDCSYRKLNVTGRMNVGGFVGYAKAATINIQYSQDKTLKNGIVNSKQKNAVTYYGGGGLIGYSEDAALTITPVDTNSEASLLLEDLTVQGNTETGNNDRVSFGGLVGYWKSNNVPVSAKNIRIEGNVIIAGCTNGSSRACVGGFVGSMADNLTSWTTSTTNEISIENVYLACESYSNISVYNGRPVGGLIGMLKAAGIIVFKNVNLGSDLGMVTVCNNRKDDENHSVGGLVGANHIVSSTVTFENINMINTTVLGLSNKDKFRGAGMIFSYAENEMTISVKNILLDRCKVVVNRADMRSGLLYSFLNKGTNINGVNILVKDCTVGATNVSLVNNNNIPVIPETNQIGLYNDGAFKSYSDLTGCSSDITNYTGCTKMGIIGGDSNGKNVILTGVSIQQHGHTTLPMKEYGTEPSDASYIVRADYTGEANGIASKVTTSPISTLGTMTKNVGEEQSTTFTVTGDGAAFYNEKQAIGTKIRDDLKVDNNLNLKHSKVSEANEYLTSKENIWSYSDFKTAGGNDFELTEDNNFPVLVLTSTSSKEINKIVYSWISVLTNRKMYLNESGVQTPTNGFSLGATTYEWKDDGKFHPMDTSPTFEVSSNTLTLIKDSYDNQKNRFTLLDAAFTDPTGGNNTYHLYIPVIVQKVLNFRFYAAAQTGTTYDFATYESLDELAIASNGEKITVLLGYEYDRTTSEWQTAVDNGDNLLGNFNKNIKLDAELPSDTKLTLVDRNRNNKAYTATYSSKENKTIDFSKFVDSNNASWSPVKLCDMLTLTAEPNEDGQYVKLKNETGATIRTTDGYYYKFVDESSRNDQELYKITVGDVVNPLSETYYLTIQTPSSDTGFYNNLITCPNRLGDALFSQPTQRKKNEGGQEYSRNKNENRIVFGNCFSQTVEITTGTSGNEINSSNRSITATLTSKIKFANGTAKNLYVAYAKDQSLYQCFELKMKDELNQQRNLAGGIAITAVYSLNEEESGLYNYVIDEQTGLFRLTYPSGIGSNTVKDLRVDQELILKASITLDFTDTAIINQFPVKNNDESNVGIQLWATSKLAFKENNLPYSTISTDANDDKYFYRKEFKTANLNYNTTGDVNNLGINGRDDDSFTVNSRAIYNVSAVEQAADAKTLRYKLTLWQKSNTESGDVAYTKVTDWGSYLEGAFDTGLSTKAHYVPKGSSIKKTAKENGNVSDGVYTVDIDLVNGLNKDVPIQIPVDLKVLTGSAFEAEGKQYIYANYKVQMEAVLLDEDGNDINGTIASDYIIYTNAKINYNYLKQPSGTQQSE